jgi:hypothetical protein
MPQARKAHVPIWERPVLKDLEIPRKWGAMARKDRESEEGKEYSRWTSAAIAAIRRANQLGVSEEEQVLNLASIGDITGVRDLWPTPKGEEPSEEKSEHEGEIPPTGDDRGAGDQRVLPTGPVPEPKSDGEMVEHSTTLKKRKVKGPTGQPPTAETQVTISAKDHLRALLTGDVGSYYCQSKRYYSWVTKKFVITTTSGDEEDQLLDIPMEDLDPLLNREMASKPLDPVELAKAFSAGDKRNFTDLTPYLRRRPSDNKVVVYKVKLRWGDDSPSIKRGKKR